MTAKCRVPYAAGLEAGVTLAGAAQQYRHAAVNLLGDSTAERGATLIRAQVAAAADDDVPARQVTFGSAPVAQPLPLPFGHAMEMVP